MNNFDKIERYLKREMSEEERTAFEAAVAQDAALAEELELHRFESELINLAIEDDLMAKVKDIAREEEQTVEIAPPVSLKKNRSIVRLRWVQAAVAASVALLAIFYIYTNLSNEFSPKELAINTYENKIPNFSGVRNIDSTKTASYKEYGSYITDKKYDKLEETIAFFKNQEGVDAIYKAGHACLLHQDFDCAIEQFLQYLDTASDKDRYFPNASFYLALAHLGNEDIAAAKPLLETIRNNPDHIFQKDAEELNEQL